MSLICCSCQFIVRDGADYTLHTADPDTLVSWDLIEQVVGFPCLISSHASRFSSAVSPKIVVFYLAVQNNLYLQQHLVQPFGQIKKDEEIIHLGLYCQYTNMNA